MHTFFRARTIRYAGAVVSLSLLATGCSTLYGWSNVHKSARGSVYIKDVADWSFEADHPAMIDQATLLSAVKGVVADDAMKSSTKMPASGSKPMRVFSDEDAEFLAPLLAQGLSQAKPEQIVGFKVSPSAGSGTEPTAGTLYVHKGSIYMTLTPSQNRKPSGFVPSSVARLEKAPSFVAMGSGAMTMVIDHQALGKSPMPGSFSVAATLPVPNAPTMKATPPQEAPIDSQDLSMNSPVDTGTPQLTTDELLNRKLDELREAREVNKAKDSEIGMLKKEVTWMKQELRQRTQEIKAMKANKTSSRSTPKRKSAEAHPIR